MMKRILLALALLIAAPAYAQELNADTNCTSAGSWTADTGWAAGSGCVGTSVSTMKMLSQMNSAIKAGHRYKLTFTLSGYSAGILRGFVGLSMPSAPAGSTVLASSVSDIADNFTTSLGLTTGVPKETLVGPGDSIEANGAWRFFCNSAGWGYIDPLVAPGLHNKHLHEFYGASNVGKSWTFTDFRTKAQSSCSGGPTGAKYAVNRSGYWFPAVLDGIGNVKRAAQILVYYKAESSPTVPTSTTITGSISGNVLTVTAITGAAGTGVSQSNTLSGAGITAGTTIQNLGTGTGGTGTYTLNNSMTVASETMTVGTGYTGGPASDITGLCASNHETTGTCANVPKGLRMTFGWRSSDNKCGPLDTDAADVTCAVSQQLYLAYTCYVGPNGEQPASPGGLAQGTQYLTSPAYYNTLGQIMAAGVCTKGSWLHVGFLFPNCWDGVNVDLPDHRSHMNYGNSSNKCQADHPVRIPSISIQAYYRIDDAFLAQKWKLASDEMAPGCYNGTSLVAVTAGCTAHADYWEAWSPTIRPLWYQNCILAHNSCTGDLGDGTKVSSGNTNSDGSVPPGNGFLKNEFNDKAPLTKFGQTPDITANGTYTFYLDCPDDQMWGFMGLGGFSGTITAIHLTDVGVTAKGPVTVHN